MSERQLKQADEEAFLQAPDARLGLGSHLATGLLWGVCLFTFPCFYVGFVIGGIAPVSVLFALTLHWLGKDGLDPLGVVTLANVVCWSTALYLLCRVTIRFIFRRLSKGAWLGVAVVVAGAASVGLLQIFAVAEHGTPVLMNAYDLLRVST